MIPACKTCNQAKGSEDWIAWYRMQPFYSIYGELRIKKWLNSGVVEEANQTDSEFYDGLINQLLPAV